MTITKQDLDNWIEREADKHLKNVNRQYSEIAQANMPNILQGEAYDAGAAMLAPLLLQAVERLKHIIAIEFFINPNQKSVLQSDCEETLSQIEAAMKGKE